MRAGLDKRLRALERRVEADLSPAAKVWLGMPLSAAERERLDAGEPDPVTTHPLAGLSREAIEWLTYDREAVRHA